MNFVFKPFQILRTKNLRVRKLLGEPDVAVAFFVLFISFTCAFFTFLSCAYRAFVPFYILLGFFLHNFAFFLQYNCRTFQLQWSFRNRCSAQFKSVFYAVLSSVRPFALVPQSNNVCKCLGLSFYTVIVIFVMSFNLSISCR